MQASIRPWPAIIGAAVSPLFKRFNKQVLGPSLDDVSFDLSP
jgi:hypothetical protein